MLNHIMIGQVNLSTILHHYDRREVLRLKNYQTKNFHTHMRASKKLKIQANVINGKAPEVIPCILIPRLQKRGPGRSTGWKGETQKRSKKTVSPPFVKARTRSSEPY